jgi:TolB-like protein/tetratricopeptide (TPR) repeat protein
VTLPDPDIFLSYNREDAAVAKTFADAFASEGFDVWWDQTLRSGEAYDRVTEDALRAAKAVVVLWSPHSVDSRWVRAEATVADQNKTLVPVTIEACRRPVMFELTQTADLSHWRGETGDLAWQAFLADVRRLARMTDKGPSRSPSPAAQTRGEGGVPFVGVLPITYRAGADEEIDVLAEDLTEDITRELAHDSFFHVIAASTMAEWRGAKINHKQLGQELGATYFVEGKLQRSADDVRLTVQLVDVATGGMLRSSRHVCPPSCIVAASELFAAAIASEFGEHVTQIEAKRALEKIAPLSGWDHVMRALAHTERLNSVSIPLAIEEAEQAIAQAPHLGLAHAVIARLTILKVVIEKRPLSEDHRRAVQEHIGRAMQLDGNNPAILHFVASAYTNLGDPAAALRIAQRTVDLNPNSPRSYFSLGQAMHVCGRYTEAIAAFHKQEKLASHDLNRSHGLMMLGVCLILDHRLVEAAEALDRSLALQPDYGAALAVRAIASALQGNEEEARGIAARVVNSTESYSIDVQVWIARQLFQERANEAEAILRRFWDQRERGS